MNPAGSPFRKFKLRTVALFQLLLLLNFLLMQGLHSHHPEKASARPDARAHKKVLVIDQHHQCSVCHFLQHHSNDGLSSNFSWPHLPEKELFSFPGSKIPSLAFAHPDLNGNKSPPLS